MKAESVSTEESESSSKNILIVGGGGIGSLLVELLVPALRLGPMKCEVTVMDFDIITERNLGHQRFMREEVGQTKVSVLANRLGSSEGVTVKAWEKNLREAESLDGFDVIIIAVDRPLPRKLVRESGLPFLDLRATGDAFVAFDHSSPHSLVDSFSPDDQPPASCQLPGAIEKGNIEFGYAMASVFGAQWALQWMRTEWGENTRTPPNVMLSLTHGVLPFPEIESEVSN